MLFEPAKDNVFLSLEAADRMTSGGIALPDSVKGCEYGPELKIARVLKAGPGGWHRKKFWPVEVTQGDRVLVRHDAGQNVIVGEHISPESAPHVKAGTEFRVVRCAEILATL